MLLKNKIVVLGLILSLFAGIAFGDTYSTTHVKKVEKLLEVVHFDKMMEQQIDTVVNNLMQDPILAKHQAEFKQLFLEMVNFDTLKKDMTTAYLKTFNEQEIDEMIKFNQSALGQKILNKMPELTQHLMTNMQKNIANNKQKIEGLFMKIAMQQKGEQK